MTGEAPSKTLRRTSGERVDFVTHMMGREVRCWWSDGAIGGDDELLERLEHLESATSFATPLAMLTALRTAVLDPITVSTVTHRI